MKTHQFAEMELAGLQNQTVHTASIKALSSISLHTSLLLQLPAGEFAGIYKPELPVLPWCRSKTKFGGFTDTVWRDVNEPKPALKLLKYVNLFADRI